MQLRLRVANWAQSFHLLRYGRATALMCCFAATGLVGCTTVPTAGPTAFEVMNQAANQPRHFDMVEINSKVVSALASEGTVDLHDGADLYDKPPSPTIGIGDTVALSIWQASNGQVFAAQNGAGQGGGNVVIPDQVVGADGSISVPYAGRIHVAGRTQFQVQQTIEQRLAEQTVQPQVIVTVTKSVSNSVTVFGEDTTAARVPLSAAGDRLVDVIAAAGGSKAPYYDVSIRLTRGGRTVTIPVAAQVSNPQADIYAWPGDIITLVRTPEKFSVFGATTNNAQVPFDAEQLNLAQAISKAGGLQDLRADPEGVFLLRFEPPTVVKALGVPNLASAPGGKSPVLYHLDLRQVEGYFLADRFAMQNDDLIYVANAPMTDLQKFFTLIGTITGPVIAGDLAANPPGVRH